MNVCTNIHASSSHSLFSSWINLLGQQTDRHCHNLPLTWLTALKLAQSPKTDCSKEVLLKLTDVSDTADWLEQIVIITLESLSNMIKHFMQLGIRLLFNVHCQNENASKSVRFCMSSRNKGANHENVLFRFTF